MANNTAIADVETDSFTKVTTEPEVQIPLTSQKATSNAFLKKCIHPPTSVPNFEGIPDNSSRSQVLLEYRGVELARRPLTHETGGNKVVPNDTIGSKPAFPGTYSYLYTNGAYVWSIAFFTNAMGSITQDYANVFVNGSYDFNNFAKDVQKYRPVYKSITCSLNATMFNDTGFVSGMQYNPQISFSGIASDLSYSNPRLFTALVRGKGKRGRQSKSPDVSRFNPIAIALLKSANLDLTIDPTAYIQVLNMGAIWQDGVPSDSVPIPTMQQEMMNSVKSYTGKAKEGTFVVQRLNTISPRWNNAGQYSTAPVAVSNLYECYYNNIDSAGQVHVVPLSPNLAEGTDLTTAPILCDTLWSEDMTFAWVTFDGLSPNPSVTGNPNNQLLVQKVYAGFEAQPAMRSPFNALARLGPKPDLLTCQALMDAFYAEKDCMPDRYNFLGGVVGSVLKGVGQSVLGSLANGTQSKPTGSLSDRFSKMKVKEDEGEEQEEIAAARQYIKERRPTKAANALNKAAEAGGRVVADTKPRGGRRRRNRGNNRRPNGPRRRITVTRGNATAPYRNLPPDAPRSKSRGRGRRSASVPAQRQRSSSNRRNVRF